MPLAGKCAIIASVTLLCVFLAGFSHVGVARLTGT